MDPLRITLLLIGLVIIGLILVWELFKRRKQTSRYKRWGINDNKVSETRVINDSVQFPEQGPTHVAAAEPTPTPVIHQPDSDDLEIIDVAQHQIEETETVITTPPPQTEQFTEPDLDSDPLDAITDELEALEQLIAEEAPQSGQLEMPELRAEPVIEKGNAKRTTYDKKPDRVIALNIIARAGESFSGTAILEQTMQNDMYYSDMGIFHKHSKGKKDIFSLANALEPGTFDLSDMENFSTSALLLFMTLPNPEPPLAAFDAMLEMAEAIAHALNGKLCDETRSVLTRQGIETIREELGIYSMKQSELAI